MSLSDIIVKERYAHPGEEHWEDVAKRVSKYVAQAEKEEMYEKVWRDFLSIISTKQFIPGGRILANAGRPRGQLMNCIVIPLDDSRESIGQMIKEYLMISGTGGGVGVSFSNLRPKGAKIRTNGGVSSGAISFMDLLNAAGETIKTGGGRRAATMISMSIYHPDIIDFIEHKTNLDRLNNANISVEIDNNFIQAVRKDKTIVLGWPPDREYKGKEIKARELWNKIVDNALRCGEPGVLNLGLANDLSNGYYFEKYTSTNPCHSGSTLVAVADGRNAVSFEQLALEDKDVPVYTYENGKIVIKTMRHPRVTGESEDVYKVTFDNGTSTKVTGNHKFILRNGDKKETLQLKPGDSMCATLADELLNVSPRKARDWKAPRRGLIRRECECCGKEFNIPNSKREISFCSDECSAKYILSEKRSHVPENIDYNCKVVSVKYVGKEKVYNGTVDDVHTLMTYHPLDDGSSMLLNSCQCGELPLPNYGACDLGAINVAEFTSARGFEWEKFKTVIPVAVRFLDNVTDVNEYPLEAIKTKCMDTRRIGLGLMGLHTAMLKMGIKYSSDDGIAFVEKLYETLRDVSYMSSAFLAKEKGSFQKFDRDLYLKGKFVKNLPTLVKNTIRNYGIRNLALNTNAPTGTTALVCGVSSGIEPIFAPVYERTFKSTEAKEGFKTEVVMDPIVESLLKTSGNLTNVEYFEGAYDITPEKHFEIQAAAQQYIDQAISKTINLPEDYKTENLSEIWLKYLDQVKGVTIYRAGSRGSEPLKPLPLNTKNIKRVTKSESVEVKCASGVCNV